jgi:ribulose-phosphate 3-epimerase
VHAEADGDFFGFANRMHRHGIEVGLALLPQTGVESIRPALRELDHVLIFSGNLGYQGGSKADFRLLKKVVTLRALKPSLEIGWDGGVNDQNVGDLVRAGVDVLNVGGFIQHAPNAAQAFAKLESLT